MGETIEIVTASEYLGVTLHVSESLFIFGCGTRMQMLANQSIRHQSVDEEVKK